MWFIIALGILVVLVAIFGKEVPPVDHTCSFCGGDTSFKFGKRGGCTCWHGSD